METNVTQQHLQLLIRDYVASYVKGNHDLDTSLNSAYSMPNTICMGLHASAAPLLRTLQMHAEALYSMTTL